MLDEPVNGLDPEGIHWIRNLLKGPRRRGAHGVRLVASDERDGADRRPPDRDRPRPADRRHERRGLHRSGLRRTLVRVRTPEAAALRALLVADRASTRCAARAGVLEVHGLTRRADRRDRGRATGIVLHELTPQQASLEEAFMDLTRDDVEFQARGRAGRGRRSQHERRSPPPTGRGRATGRSRRPRDRLGVDEAPRRSARRATRSSRRVLLTIGIAALACGVVAHHWPHMSPHDRADFHPLEVNLAGVQLAQLAIGVLGVLVITGEYSTGMIRATFDRRAEAAARALGQGRSSTPRSARAHAARDAHRVRRRRGDPRAPPHRRRVLRIPASRAPCSAPRSTSP